MIKNLLRDPNVNFETVRTMIDSIEVTGRRIEKIMRTVRALSHGGEAEPLQKVSLAALVDSALDIVGARMKNRGVKLQIELHAAERVLDCRPSEIFQILVNLLNNATDAALMNPNETCVRLRPRDDGGGVSVFV